MTKQNREPSAITNENGSPHRAETPPIFGMIGLGIALISIILCLALPWMEASVPQQSADRNQPPRPSKPDQRELETPEENRPSEHKSKWSRFITKKLTSEIKRKISKKIGGEMSTEATPVKTTPNETKRTWGEAPANKWIAFSTLSLGVSAFLLGVVGTCRREHQGVCGCAIILGIGTIVLYYFLSVLVGIAALFLLVMFFASLDISI